MQKYYKPFLLLFSMIMTPAMCLAITACMDPQPGDQYPKVPTCMPADKAPSDVTPPFVAILQPALEQDDDLVDMQSTNYRYIDLPVGQPYEYALYKDDPSEAIMIDMTPIMQNGKAALHFSIAGKQAAAFLQHQNTVMQTANSCQIDLKNKAATCDSFTDFAKTIAPMVKLFDKDDYPTVEAWAGINPSLVEVKVNSSQQAYLSVRYGSVCTGTLVSNNQILTAAHCMLDISASPAQIDPSALHDIAVIGSNWQTSDKVYPIDASKINLTDTIAPGYLPNMDESNDFAIVPLMQSVVGVTPAKISSLAHNAQPTYVAGFGMTEPMHSKTLPTDPAAKVRALAAVTSVDLLYGKNTIMQHSVCQANYSKAGLSTQEAGFSDLICAGDANEVAFCAGDSGGLLFAASDDSWDKDTQFTLYGVVSGKGAQCQNEALVPKTTDEWVNIPGLYAKVQPLCSSTWFKDHGLSCIS
ncbi:MAG: trypsin-like serine protease [Coxiellaceae bacterium]|nr:trypsin-like serine protease [Coxiellaceae bacterium]